jgi:aminoglycoside phosphotransferase (APT) family kinase protein
MAVAADDPGRCVAVYDWDMCTVGDPFTDLGTLLSSWYEPGDPTEFLSPMPSRSPGFLTRRSDRALRRAAAATSRRCRTTTSSASSRWPASSRSHFRWKQGQTQDARMSGGEAVAEGLIGLAHDHMSRPAS